MLADRINNLGVFPASELLAAKARAAALEPEGWADDLDKDAMIHLYRERIDELKKYRQAVKAYCDLADGMKQGKTICLSDRSMGERYIPYFLEKLNRSQKFKLSPLFTSTTLEKLATPETVVKSREFFNLAHNPMWLEWRYDLDDLRDLLEGALVFAEATAPKGEVMAYLFCGVRGSCTCKLVRFYPDTLRLENDDMKIDWELVSGAQREDGKRDVEIDLVTDFIIRINSPRITEIRPGEDLTALNKKRLRNGKLALYDFRTVELNQDVKNGLKLSEQADSGSVGHRRVHWRRGHFKCCRTGIFWWNPHLAGRRDLGVVDKRYAA